MSKQELQNNFSFKQTKVKQQAFDLQQKFKKLKLKKQKAFAQELKQTLSKDYQQQYQTFKTSSTEYFQSQVSSLSLVKELRTSELKEFLSNVLQTSKRLDQQQNQAILLLEEVRKSYIQAQNFLRSSQQGEIKQIREKLWAQHQKRMAQYEAKVDID